MEAIRRRLDELGKTRVELARALDIGPPVISKILSGQRVLKAQELPVLAAFLRWPVTTLVGALSSSPAKSNGRTTDGPARQWIASRLDELGKTKTGLARALGLPKARVFEIINGTRRVQLSELSPLAAYLNTEEEELLSLFGQEQDVRLSGANAGVHESLAPSANDEENWTDEEAESFNHKFRQRLIEVRTGLGWTQARMAGALGIPEANYKKYETRSMLPHYLLPRLSLASGRSLPWLITGYG